MELIKAERDEWAIKHEITRILRKQIREETKTQALGSAAAATIPLQRSPTSPPAPKGVAAQANVPAMPTAEGKSADDTKTW
jgi:hypothetical protein